MFTAEYGLKEYCQGKKSLNFYLKTDTHLKVKYKKCMDIYCNKIAEGIDITRFTVAV